MYTYNSIYIYIIYIHGIFHIIPPYPTISYHKTSDFPPSSPWAQDLGQLLLLRTRQTFGGLRAVDGTLHVFQDVGSDLANGNRQRVHHFLRGEESGKLSMSIDDRKGKDKISA